MMLDVQKKPFFCKLQLFSMQKKIINPSSVELVRIDPPKKHYLHK